MTAGEKQAMRIGLIGVLVPVVSGVLMVFLSEAIKDSVVLSWTMGALFLVIGVCAGSIPLFSLKLTWLKKWLLIFGYLIFSFVALVFSALWAGCNFYNDCL